MITRNRLKLAAPLHRTPTVREGTLTISLRQATRVTPSVKWEVTSTTRETNGDVPIVVKKLTGQISVDPYLRAK